MVLILSVIVPFALSFLPALKFYSNFRALLASLSLIVVIFGGWDVYATYRGHWYFDPNGVVGVRILNLPLEEAMFFVVIPFCCIFSWEALKLIKGRMR